MATPIGSATALAMAAIALRGSKDGLSKEKLAELQKKQKEGQEAIDKVLLARKQARSDRKGMARQKLEQIKQRIQMLKQMAVNSKSAARELARLARELKGAAREYRQTAPASEIATSESTPDSMAAEREAEAKADKEFANEVKAVGRLIKAMLKRRDPEDEEEKRGLNQARKDLKTADEDASAIIAQAGGEPGLSDVGLLV